MSNPDELFMNVLSLSTDKVSLNKSKTLGYYHKSDINVGKLSTDAYGKAIFNRLLPENMPIASTRPTFSRKC